MKFINRYINSVWKHFVNSKINRNSDTGKSFSEALILAPTNPQYDKRLFIDLPVQYMKTTSSEHVVYIFFSSVFVLTFKTIYVQCSFHVSDW